MIGNKIVNKLTKVSATSPQNNSGTVTNETENIRLDREIPKEGYLFPERKKKISNVLILV